MRRAVNRGAAQLAVQTGLLDRAGHPIRGLPTNLVTGSTQVLIGVWQGALLTAGRFTPGARRSALRLSCPTPETVLALAGMARRLGVDTDITTSSSHGNEITIHPVTHIAAMLTLVGAPVTAGRTTRISASRPRTTTPASTRQNFNAANRDRSLSAAAAMTDRINRALDVLGARAPLHLAEAGRLRMSHPDLSLLELGKLAQPPVTKDTIAGRIRRLTTLGDPDPRLRSRAVMLVRCGPRAPGPAGYRSESGSGRGGHPALPVSVALHGSPQSELPLRLRSAVITASRLPTVTRDPLLVHVGNPSSAPAKPAWPGQMHCL